MNATGWALGVNLMIYVTIQEIYISIFFQLIKLVKLTNQHSGKVRMTFANF